MDGWLKVRVCAKAGREALFGFLAKAIRGPEPGAQGQSAVPSWAHKCLSLST